MSELKTCNKCKELLPLEAFYSVKQRAKNKIYHICKACCALQKQSMKGYYRDWELKKKYGISLQEYTDASLKLDGKCEICQKKVDSLHVDHSHITGEVRGFLCGSCNRGLGLFQDRIDLLALAFHYLKQYEDTSIHS